ERDGLLARGELADGVAADHFLRLGERAVRDGDRPAGEADARAVGERLQPCPVNEHALLRLLADELSHRLVERRRRGDAGVILGVLDEHHESHRSASWSPFDVWVVERGRATPGEPAVVPGAPTIRRTGAAGIDMG